MRKARINQEKNEGTRLAGNARQRRNCRSIARLIVADESGQVIPWVVVMMFAVLATAALVVDVGHAMVIQRELQASADAAALAAAQSISGSSTSYSTVGTTYSAGSGDNNAYTGVSVGTPTVTPLCLTTVSGWGIPCTVSSGKVTVPNAVSVTETATVPTLFAGIFGKPNITLSATSTATNARPVPYNIALIVDSTLSMNDTDSNCGGITQEQCALNGVQQLLEGLNTTYDHVALFTFPNVVAGSNAQAGVAITNAGVAQTFGCTTSVPSSYLGVSYWNLSPGYTPIIKPINTSSGDNSQGSTTSTRSEQLDYQPPWTGIAWALPYSFPPAPTTTSGYSIPSGSYPPTYQITPFLEDYNTVSSGGTTSLNSSSNLIKAVGAVSGCGGLAPSSYDGDFGTYYPGAIYAAQAALLKEQTSHTGSSNAIIILGDGNATAPQYWPGSTGPEFAMPSSASAATTTYLPATSHGSAIASQSLNTSAYTYPTGWKTASSNGSYPSWVGECGQAVTAAQYAAKYATGSTANNTLVFTIAYGSPAQSNSSDCGSDVGAGTSPNITPCQAMQEMATQVTGDAVSPYFYSDYKVTGGDSGCTANSDNSGITAISDIYQAIGTKLLGARLIPNGTT
ncbi:MAG: pilus assembly protein TadG-related protein [Acidobacteriaceae bacterium]